MIESVEDAKGFGFEWGSDMDAHVQSGAVNKIW